MKERANVQTPQESPPEGAPWDVPLAECVFACMDCEMTGTSVDHDALVEIAVERVQNGKLLQRFSQIVRTEVLCVPGAFAMHGITTQEIAAAPTFAEIAPAFCEAIHGAVVVAHGVDLDVPMLNRALENAGRTERMNYVLDSIVLARRAVHAHTYSLSSLGTRLSLGTFRWHRAGEDARAVASLLEHLIGVFKPRTARELWDIRVGEQGPVHVRPALDVLFTRLAGHTKPVTLLVRTPGKDPYVLRARIERWNTPHLLLAPVGRKGNALKLLRADRVLHATEE
jgi:DNA polymerase III subunit epsilon